MSLPILWSFAIYEEHQSDTETTEGTPVGQNDQVPLDAVAK